MANRRKKLARHLRILRTADQRPLARLVRDYAHRPDEDDIKAAAIHEAHRIGVNLFEMGFSTGGRLSLHQLLVAAGRAEYRCGAGTYRLAPDGTCRNGTGVLYGAAANKEQCIGMSPDETAAEMRRYYCIL